jgi:hypothetical protein
VGDKFGVTTKSDHYLEKAAEFEALANATADAAMKAAYADLARGYRRLAAHLHGGSFGKSAAPQT